MLNYDYAAQIARDWNTTDTNSGYMGAVTAFEVATDYLAQFAEQVVGGAVHRELWIPADKLAGFNQHIVGQIRIVAAFYGDQFAGEKEW